MKLAHDLEPMKIGVLMDIISPGRPADDEESLRDLLQPMRLIFKEAVESGRLDRPIESYLTAREFTGEGFRTVLRGGYAA